MPPTETLKVDDLTIDVDESHGQLRLDWTGRSTHRDPGQLLHPFFERILERAKTRNVPVSMHFEKLQQFNSSTIAALIQVINTARSTGVGLLVHYDKSLKWQTLSFDALQRAIEPFSANSEHPVQFVALKQK